MYAVKKFESIPGLKGSEKKTLRKTKYPFDLMRPGTMFFVPLGAGDDMTRLKARISSSVSYFKKKNGDIKMITRATKEDGQLGVGVYQLES